MLGKLMKYEWRGYRFPLVIMLIVLAVTTLLTCSVIFTINPEYDSVIENYSVAACILSFLLYYFGLIGCFLGTMIIIAVRFYKTCYTDQGYLTHTLPVSPVTTLNAKLISAILMYLLMLVAVAATILIIIQAALHHIYNLYPDDMYLIKMQIPNWISSFKDEFGISLGGFTAFWIFYMIIACAANIITILGCVSLGQLYAKHRVVGAIVAYFAVNTIEQIIGYICSIPTYRKMFVSEITTESSATPFSIMSPSMITSLILAVTIAVVMYFANLHMMTKRLNLE